MPIFCTGATGFVGAHAALALLQEGRALRLLVRNPAAAHRWFSARGHDVDIVTADICDPIAVRRSMAGCDSVFHAAAMVSLDPRTAQAMYDTNVGATKAVFDAAEALGVGRAVYVSSVTALFHPGAARVDESTPLADVSDPYSRSKRDSDEYVRRLQRRGMPIQTTYPVGVIGPDDPKLSASNRALTSFVRQVLPRSTSGLQVVDVRDLALAHRWLLARPAPGDPDDARFIVGGHYYPWDELRRRLESVLGRRVVSPRVPSPVMRGMGVLADSVREVVPFESQISAESMSISTRGPCADSSRYLAASGLTFRPGDDTLRDTIRWLAAAGHLSARKAGALASSQTTSASERRSC